MEGSRVENTGDINEAATTPMKRVLRSRIVEVDNNSNACSGGNAIDSTSSQLNSQTDEVDKGNLEVDVTSTPAKVVGVKTELKCTTTPDDKKRPDLADDNQSQPSLSPVSQCGSEASNVSVRVLRSKCVVIKLESIDKVLNKVDEEPTENGITDDNSKENDKRDEIASNSEIINVESVSDSVVNDKAVELDTPVDSNDKCEIMLNNHGESINNGDDDDVSNVEDNDSVEKEGRLIIEETEENSCSSLRVEAEDPSESMVSLSSIDKNESDSTKSKEIIIEESNKDEPSKENETLENAVGNESDTTEESECTLNVRNITKRKPICTSKEVEKCTEDYSNQTQTNVEKTIDNETVINGEIENETANTTINSEKTINISSDSIVSSELDDESTLVLDECLISEKMKENSVTINIAKDSENLSIDTSKNEKLQLVTSEGKSKTSVKSKEPESVHEPSSEVLEVEEQVDNEDSFSEVLEIEVEEQVDNEKNYSEIGQKHNGGSPLKCQKIISKNAAAADDVITRSNRKKVLEPDRKSTSRLNLTNVLDLLSVDKSSINKMLHQNDIPDSGSETEISNSATSHGKITKHTEIVDNPPAYYGIGEDLLKNIIKEAAEGALVEVKQELESVKHQLANITTLLNGMRKGKKRKFDSMNMGDIHDDGDYDEIHDKLSVSSSSSISTADELLTKVTVPMSKSSPSKGMKSKDDLIKELLEDVSDHFQVPVKAKKKRKLFDLSGDVKKNKKEMKLVKTVPIVKESVGSMSFSNDVIPNDNTIKKKKKKNKFLQDNSEALLVDGSVKNKVNNRQSLLRDAIPDEDYSIDLVAKKNKKKKKLNHDSILERESENFSDFVFDWDNMNNVQELSKKKKKRGNKNKSSLLENDAAVLKSRSNSDKTPVLSEEILSKKKKKKKNIISVTNPSSEIILSSDNKVNNAINYDETDKKKKKKKKLNAPINDNVGDDESSQFNVIKKKKKKLNLLNDQQRSSASGSNVNIGFGDVHLFESFNYGNSSHPDEQGLLKKMKSWKSKNKSQLYRATPYKDTKNKRMKLDASIN